MKGLAGVWYGARGSRLELDVQHDGTLEGQFYTSGDDPSGRFTLVGMSDTRTFNGCRSFGFVVCWNNEFVNQHSVTSWSGQYQVANGEEVLRANWLLTRETTPDEGWASTLVGQDTFYRTPVGETEMQHDAAPVA